jgi:hypothetical protein
MQVLVRVVQVPLFSERWWQCRELVKQEESWFLPAQEDKESALLVLLQKNDAYDYYYPPKPRGLLLKFGIHPYATTRVVDDFPR